MSHRERPEEHDAAARRSSTGEKHTYPTTVGQQRLWYDQCLHPDDPTLNIANAVLLTKPVRVDEARWAIEFVAQRHEILRTRHVLTPAGLRQQVVAGAPPIVTVTTAAATRESLTRELRETALRIAAAPFDLRHGAPMRAALLVTSAPCVVGIVLVVHHICWDSASAAIFWQDLRNCLVGGPDQLPVGPRRQYREYAEMEQQAHYRERLRHSVQQCMKHVRPTDDEQAAETAGQDDAPAAYAPLHLATQVGLDVVDAARASNRTLFTVLLSAVVSALSRVSSRSAVHVAIDTSLRPFLPEFDRTIGFFANQVLLPPVPRTTRLDDTLDTVEAALREALQYLDAPYNDVVRMLRGQAAKRPDPFEVKVHLADERLMTSDQFLNVAIDPPIARHRLTVGFVVTPAGAVTGAVNYRVTGSESMARARGLARTITSILSKFALLSVHSDSRGETVGTQEGP